MLVALSLVLVVPGVVQAGSSQGHVTARLPTQVDGQATVQAQSARFLVEDGQVSANLDGAHIDVSLYIYEERYAVDDVRTDRVELVESQRRVRTWTLTGEQLNVGGRDATLLIDSADRLTATVDGEVQPAGEIQWEQTTDLALQSAEEAIVEPDLLTDADAYRHRIPEGVFGYTAREISLSSHETLSLYATDARVTFTNDREVVTLHTGSDVTYETASERLGHETGAHADAPESPVAGGGNTDRPQFEVHRTRYVVIQTRPSQDARPQFALQSSSPSFLHGAVTRMDVQGTAKLSDAVGELRVADTTYRFDRDEVEISGRLTFTPHPQERDGDRMPYTVQGEVSHLVVGDQSYDVTEDPMVAIVVGLSVGIAGLLAYAWPMVKFGLFNALGAPLYTRLKKDKVLGHDVRQRIYDIIQDDPGISISQVAEQADVGWGTAVYHLGVLEESDLVVSMRDGRYKRYYQNGGRYNGKKEALAAIRNDTTRDVVSTVLENPGITQTGLCDRLDISAPLAHWHLKRLKEADLVGAERDGRYKRHYIEEPARDILQAHLN